MPAITSTNVATAIVKLVAADALPALVSNLIMGNLVNRDYEPTLAQAGTQSMYLFRRHSWQVTSQKAGRLPHRIPV